MSNPGAMFKDKEWWADFVDEMESAKSAGAKQYPTLAAAWDDALHGGHSERLPSAPVEKESAA